MKAIGELPVHKPDRAQRPGGHEPAGLRYHLGPGRAAGHRHDPVLLAPDPLKLLGLRHGEGQWFLADHVQPVFQRRLGNRVVGAVRRGNHHRLETVIAHRFGGKHRPLVAMAAHRIEPAVGVERSSQWRGKAVAGRRRPVNPAFQSRHLADRIDDESIWLANPDLADVFVGRKSGECLQSAGKVMGVQDVGKMAAQLLLAVVAIASGRRMREGAVHAHDLAVPR